MERDGSTMRTVPARRERHVNTPTEIPNDAAFSVMCVMPLAMLHMIPLGVMLIVVSSPGRFGDASRRCC